MKHIHYLYIASLAFLIACSSEERIQTTDHTNGPIELSAGIVESPSKATTRTGAEDHHANHQTFTSGTKLALQISGIWTGHSPSTSIVQPTTAIVGSATGTGNLHNELACKPVRYWDEYGTADPANTGDASKGRNIGLTIYGAAINGKTTAPEVSNFSALSWTLPADQTTTNNTPADYDLLISNNIKIGTGDGTYKFDERNAGKLLEFTHALSKITVNLNANSGFNGGSFSSDPEVKLTSNNASTSIAEWAYRTGIVNVTTGAVTSLSNNGVITMWQAASAPTGYDVTKEALVMPDSKFTDDDAIIARINADGNIYYVTAEKIRTAINSSTHGTDGAYSTEAGKNYIINVTVNKTDIVVTATVANWSDVEAAVVEPVINVSGDLGDAANASSDNTFSFYRSTSLNNGYSTKTGDYYGEESVLTYTASSTTWSMSPTLYWPNHNTHYQFRAVWPRTVTTGEGLLPRVEDGTADNGTNGYQVIKVANVAYSAGSFPSDLQIARPNVANADQNCGNNETGHTKKNLYTEGICAREGAINLTFKYMMAKIEVNLSTTDTEYDRVPLDGAVVEITNVHTTGDVKLGDREVVPTGDAGSYTLNVDANDANKRLSAIVPQELIMGVAHANTNVQFRITITNNNNTPADLSDDTQDIYYADIAPIKKTSSSSDYVAKHVTSPDKWYWESGVHYVYNLKLSKTEVKVTATLANWTTVNATQDIWF